MNAILYVAGRAGRLGKLTENNHKILFEFGGQSLLERHVAILARLGVPTLYIVTGHLREMIVAQFPVLQARYPVQLEEIYNPDYTEGSVISMLVSVPVLSEVRDEVLIMDGDVLYDYRLLERLICSPRRTVLLIDRNYTTHDDDPVIVPVKEDRPFEFLKKWKGRADFSGESVGFFKVNVADLPVLIDETVWRGSGSRRAESYDEILRAMVKAGLFQIEDITGLPWTEIDFPEDLEHAEKNVVPLLVRP